MGKSAKIRHRRRRRHQSRLRATVTTAFHHAMNKTANQFIRFLMFGEVVYERTTP